MKQSFDAFIFDLDGTLVDSASITDRVMQEWCDEHEIDFEAVSSSHSSRTIDTVREVAPHLDSSSEAQKIENKERESLIGLQEIPGAFHFLRKLQDEQWAVATSSDTETAKKKMEVSGLPMPKALIGADQVNEGKPNPEAYLKASKVLGYSATDCLAFEDSETGVRSALSAGCSVVLVGAACNISDPKILFQIKDFDDIDVSQNSHLKLEIKWAEQGSGGNG